MQTDTIRPIVEQMVQRGAYVYTDGYCIYHLLSREGFQHLSVNHGGGEYARDLDGDGKWEVHCNTVECTWSWLRQMVRTYRDVRKVYLPLYDAQFEFLYNRRHQNHLKINTTLGGRELKDLITAQRATGQTGTNEQPTVIETV